jgi:hypothetical protein
LKRCTAAEIPFQTPAAGFDSDRHDRIAFATCTEVRVGGAALRASLLLLMWISLAGPLATDYFSKAMCSILMLRRTAPRPIHERHTCRRFRIPGH